MKLSVIVVSFNTRDLTLSCLKSIEKSGFRGKLEVVVVDNASTDGSVEAIQSSFQYGGQAKFKVQSYNPKIKIIRNKENVGFAKANNQGTRKAKGGYILLLNSDTEVKRGSLDKLVEFVAGKEDGVVVGARLLNGDGTVQESVMHLPTLGRAIEEFWLGRKRWFGKYVPKSKGPVEVEAVVGAAMLVPKKVIDKVGLLDERYFFYFEDLDYCRRVRCAGFKVYYLPAAAAVHYHGASGKGQEAKMQRRLVAASKIYHGALGHWLVWWVMWTGQKWQKLVGRS